MKKIAFLILILLALSGSAQAQHFHNGHVNSDGYHYRDGYWYYPGYSSAYTRTYTQGYYGSCGRYYPGYYNYSAYSAPAPTYQLPQAPTYSKDWKTELLKYAEAQKDVEAYERALRGLGISPGLQYNPAYGYTHTQYFGANGSTPYAYSQRALAQAYGDNDLNSIAQAYSQNVNSALSLGSTAVGGQKDFVQELFRASGNNQARVAEILAKGQAGAQILRAMGEPLPLRTVTEIKATALPGMLPEIPSGKQDAAADGDLQEFVEVLNNKCAACHSGAIKKGGLDLSNYLNFTADLKARVFARIEATDPNMQMPPPGKGQRVTPRESRLFHKF